MSEKLSGSGEKFVESIDTSVESQKNLEKLRDKAEAAENDPIQKHIESLSKSVEQQAISGKELNVGDKTTESSQQSFGNTKHLKADAYKRSIKNIQGNLSLPNKVMSKVIHQPMIDSVSNATAKTVARPSVLLGGGIGAFIGSAALLYLSRYSGFTYNYTVIFILFIGGFFVGALTELLIKTFFRKR